MMSIMRFTVMTNADRVRQMTDDELEDLIYRFMDNAARCPTCFRNTGRERLRLWLELPVLEDKHGKTEM